MANTKKETTATSGAVAKKSTKTEVDVEKLRKENETLKQENSMFQAKLADMDSKMELLLQQFAFMKTPATKLEKDIEVINLSVGNLVLSTNGKDSGRIYIFEKQFDTLFIPEEDLKLIVLAMPKTARGGYFYINDIEFVKNNNLAYSYRTLLDGTELENILNLSGSEFISKYNSATRIQQSIIQSMVISNLFSGSRVDGNILYELEQVTGVNYRDIIPFNKD